jgi:hypothetical protein
MPKTRGPETSDNGKLLKDDAQREIDCELGCVRTEIVAPVRVIRIASSVARAMDITL